MQVDVHSTLNLSLDVGCSLHTNVLSAQLPVQSYERACAMPVDVDVSSSVSSSLSGAAANTWEDILKYHMAGLSDMKATLVNKALGQLTKLH